MTDEEKLSRAAMALYAKEIDLRNAIELQSMRTAAANMRAMAGDAVSGATPPTAPDLLPCFARVLDQFNGAPRHFNTLEGNKNTVQTACSVLLERGYLKRISTGVYQRALQH
jgi:hypothetical protein